MPWPTTSPIARPDAAVAVGDDVVEVAADLGAVGAGLVAGGEQRGRRPQGCCSAAGSAEAWPRCGERARSARARSMATASRSAASWSSCASSLVKRAALAGADLQHADHAPAVHQQRHGQHRAHAVLPHHRLDVASAPGGRPRTRGASPGSPCRRCPRRPRPARENALPAPPPRAARTVRQSRSSSRSRIAARSTSSTRLTRSSSSLSSSSKGRWASAASATASSPCTRFTASSARARAFSSIVCIWARCERIALDQEQHHRPHRHPQERVGGDVHVCVGSVAVGQRQRPEGHHRGDEERTAARRVGGHARAEPEQEQRAVGRCAAGEPLEQRRLREPQVADHQELVEAGPLLIQHHPARADGRERDDQDGRGPARHTALIGRRSHREERDREGGADAPDHPDELPRRVEIRPHMGTFPLGEKLDERLDSGQGRPFPQGH